MTDEESRRVHRRALFDGAAETYDRVRPRYPPQLFDDLAELARLEPGSRVLEVGCGTGQATTHLAERGYRVTALELGTGLAAVARRRLARRENVEVVTADFETCVLPAEAFDAALFATSFHWLDPATRAARAADAVRPGGAVASIRTHHVAGGTERFFAEVQACYERWDPETEPGLRLEAADDVPVDSEGLDGSDRLAAPVVRRHDIDIRYSREGYLDVLATYSGHLALEPGARRGLLDCIGGLIDERYGGSIVKRYLFELFVARVL